MGAAPLLRPQTRTDLRADARTDSLHRTFAVVTFSKADKDCKFILGRYKSYADVVGHTNIGTIRELFRRGLIRLLDSKDLEGRGCKFRRSVVLAVVNPKPDVRSVARTMLKSAARISAGKAGDRAASFTLMYARSLTAPYGVPPHYGADRTGGQPLHMQFKGSLRFRAQHRRP